MKLTKGYDELAERRATEIDEIIDQLAGFAAPPPVKVGVMFESLLLSYAALRTRHGEQMTVLLGQAAYDRAKASGLLAWCREHYPNLTFEPPAHAVRGCQSNLAIVDEAVEF